MSGKTLEDKGRKGKYSMQVSSARVKEVYVWELALTWSLPIEHVCTSLQWCSPDHAVNKDSTLPASSHVLASRPTLESIPPLLFPSLSPLRSLLCLYFLDLDLCCPRSSTQPRVQHASPARSFCPSLNNAPSPPLALCESNLPPLPTLDTIRSLFPNSCFPKSFLLTLSCPNLACLLNTVIAH